MAKSAPLDVMTFCYRGESSSYGARKLREHGITARYGVYHPYTQAEIKDLLSHRQSQGHEKEYAELMSRYLELENHLNSGGFAFLTNQLLDESELKEFTKKHLGKIFVVKKISIADLSYQEWKEVAEDIRAIQTGNTSGLKQLIQLQLRHFYV